jgi:hypothetical protein
MNIVSVIYTYISAQFSQHSCFAISCSENCLLSVKAQLGVRVATVGSAVGVYTSAPHLTMAPDPTAIGATNWRNDLPTLAGRLVVLREIGPQDLGPLVDLL